MSKRKASFDSRGSDNSSANNPSKRKASFDLSLASNNGRKSSFDLSGNLLEDPSTSSYFGNPETTNLDEDVMALTTAPSNRSEDDHMLLEVLGGLRSRSNTIGTLDTNTLGGALGSLSGISIGGHRSRSNTLDTLGTAGFARSRSSSIADGGYHRYRSNSIDELAFAASALQHSGIIDDLTAVAANLENALSHPGAAHAQAGQTQQAQAVAAVANLSSSPLMSANVSVADDVSTTSVLYNDDLQRIVQSAVAACAHIDVESHVSTRKNSDAENADAAMMGAASHAAFAGVDPNALESAVAAALLTTPNTCNGSAAADAGVGNGVAAPTFDINYDEIASMAVPMTSLDGRELPGNTFDRSKTPVRSNLSCFDQKKSSAKRQTPKENWAARERLYSQGEHDTAVPIIVGSALSSSSYPVVSNDFHATKAVSYTRKHIAPSSFRETIGSSCGQEKGQSNQKWDEMFDCLKQYVANKRMEEMAKGHDISTWVWCGNVPTNFKTKDGKALGRWVNNQRSSKNKGSLKKEREDRLLSTGLKWSVLSTNAWPDMMNELRIYVAEKTKSGQKWDGNVPTNYKIKFARDGTELEEEKNLGRWINRQRSLFQSNRLRKDRQLELEKLGLKWSVLSTTSWDSMYASLHAYANEGRKMDPVNGWNGDVPASYKTKCQKSLGRWVNRQRAAYAKNKLKREYVLQLERLGLKWTADEAKKTSADNHSLLTNGIHNDPVLHTIVASLTESAAPTAAVKTSGGVASSASRTGASSTKLVKSTPAVDDICAYPVLSDPVVTLSSSMKGVSDMDSTHANKAAV